MKKKNYLPLVATMTHAVQSKRLEIAILALEYEIRALISVFQSSEKLAPGAGHLCAGNDCLNARHEGHCLRSAELMKEPLFEGCRQEPDPMLIMFPLVFEQCSGKQSNTEKDSSRK